MENRKEQSINIQLPKSITEDSVENIFKIHLNEEIVELGNRPPGRIVVARTMDNGATKVGREDLLSDQ